LISGWISQLNNQSQSQSQKIQRKVAKNAKDRKEKESKSIQKWIPAKITPE